MITSALRSVCAVAAIATILTCNVMAQGLVDRDGIFRGAFDPPELAQMKRKILLLELPGFEQLNPFDWENTCGQFMGQMPCDDFGADFVAPEPLSFHFNFPDDAFAEATAFSSDTGRTYWGHAVAPDGPQALIPLVDPDYRSTGLATQLRQDQWFIKRAPTASMQLKITQVHLQVADYTGLSDCPWLTPPNAAVEDCRRMHVAAVEFLVSARVDREYVGIDEPPEGVFFRRHGAAELTGVFPELDLYVPILADRGPSIWDDQDFDIEVVEDGHWIVTLLQPISVRIPLNDIEVGESFVVNAQLVVAAINNLGRETYVSAFFRDPVEFEGAELEYEGVDPVEGPVDFFPITVPERAVTCENPGAPNGGTIEFVADSYRTPEIAFAPGVIEVHRSGGSLGQASVYLSTHSGTATQWEDYRTVRTHVVFENGEEGTRVVRIPIIMDDDVEGVERLTLTLSDPSGCATLGERALAELLILDDDRPPVSRYMVCGAVSGLEGTGLQLRNRNFPVDDIFPSNGAFCFPRDYIDGTPYEVLVETQPGNPPQVCNVSNGRGTLQGGDVSDVEVTCQAPQGNVALDSTFGSSGIVAGPLSGGATAMALQQDGKILVVGRVEVHRYLANGELDLTFGTDGLVEVGGIGSGTLNGIVVQDDGKVVVTGHDNADFRTYRFNADGSDDLGFGSDGVVITDWAGRVDRAHALAIQPDGKILVVGHQDNLDIPNNVLGTDVAIVRYLSSGALDTSFSADGTTTVDIAGGADFGHAVRLQSDGKILVAGRVADSGSATPDIAIVRLQSDGTLDISFGDNGIAWPETPDEWDQADHMALQPDGKIVIAGLYNERGPTPTPIYSFGVSRYLADGRPDLSFGDNGRLTSATFAPQATASAVAVQPDGKIVVVGDATIGSSPNEPDFAIARYLSDGSPDLSFGSDAQLLVDFFEEADDAKTVVVQPDGKILVAGSVRNAGDSSLGMVRILAQ